MKSSHSQEGMSVKQNKTYHYYEGWIDKLKEASFFLSSVKKALVFLALGSGIKKLHRESFIQFAVK